jgi:hypothetical protein
MQQQGTGTQGQGGDDERAQEREGRVEPGTVREDAPPEVREAEREE